MEGDDEDESQLSDDGDGSIWVTVKKDNIQLIHSHSTDGNETSSSRKLFFVTCNNYLMLINTFNNYLIFTSNNYKLRNLILLFI